MEIPQIVIGSGPAGISAAKALLARGFRVLLIDGGAQLDDERTQRLETLAAAHPGSWQGGAGAWLRDGMKASTEGIPLKLAYGSDFPYRMMPGAPSIEGDGVNTKFSMGKGGLSTVWGSAVMPFLQQDLGGWPVTADELAPYYRAVLGFMPAAEGVDDLTEMFPLFREPGEAGEAPMPLSAQAQALLGTLEGHRGELRAAGVRFGRSRLAIQSSRCVRCGLCMYGCPYGLIYSTAQTVDELAGAPGFTYAPGYVAQRIEETASGVRVHTLNPAGQNEVLEGDRVYVGAGVLASASLLLRTLEAYDQPVTFKESHYFLIPMLRLAGVEGFNRNDLHTLAQFFIEVMDESLSPNMIHLQTYTYNDLMEQPIRQMLGPLRGVFPWTAFMSRLYLFQGYLHSDHSPLTEGRLLRRGDSDTLRLVATERPEATVILKKLLKKLRQMRGLTGMLPISPMMKRGEPGRGFHTGGSFPMALHPTGFESDTLGRPGGMQRVHVVDSSVLPSIPATTITYTVMANAYRIGTLAGA